MNPLTYMLGRVKAAKPARAISQRGAALLLVAMIATPFAAHASRVVVLDVAGDAQARAAKSTQPIKLEVLASLETPSTVTLARDTRLKVLYPDSNAIYEFTGPRTINLQRDRPAAGHGEQTVYKSSVPAAFRGVRLAPGKVVPATKIMRGDPAHSDGGCADAVELAEPRGAVLPTDTITFRWKCVRGADEYVLEIADMDGNQIAKTTLNKTEHPYSPGVLRLNAGQQYRWSVTANMPGPATQWNWGEFSVAPKQLAERMAELRPADDAPRHVQSLYVLALLAHDLKQSAAVESSRLAARSN